MRIIKLLINEKVASRKTALTDASADDVIDQCLEYLKSLSEYRDQLQGLHELPEVSNVNQSLFAVEMVSQARAAVRAAIEITLSETARTNALLNSFTSIDIYEAAETLNTFRYNGSNNWSAGPIGLRFSNGFDNGFIPTIQALETASKLRRDAYVLLNRDVSRAEN